ncbi:hypothetical protein HYALB_00004630 [Hymenoscyphus albidus]|uniref:Uncharacterized protein n=1 Tax=Hymenoscyphus albidus TaxID=595503 RepID=A0A9N9QCY0_9HELO|nr:hypothetical protein HYALB_00004630 [Hymenoscyphus albidus]
MPLARVILTKNLAASRRLSPLLWTFEITQKSVLCIKAYLSAAKFGSTRRSGSTKRSTVMEQQVARLPGADLPHGSSTPIPSLQDYAAELEIAKDHSLG